MTKFLRFFGTAFSIIIVVVVFFASIEPPARFHAKSWLGVFNKWIFDSEWEEGIVHGSFLLTKTSLTDDSLALGVACGLEQQSLALVLYSDPSRGRISSDITISFDEGPYFNEQWIAQKEKGMLILSGAPAYALLRRMFTSNVLKIRIDGRGTFQDDFTFYLEGLRDYEPGLIRHCKWEK